MISFIVSFLLNFFLWLSIFVGVRLRADGFYISKLQVHLTNVVLLINGTLLLLYFIVFFAQKRWKRWYPFRLNGLYIVLGCWWIVSLENARIFQLIAYYTILFVEIMLINEMFTRDFRKKPAFCGFCAVMLLLWAIIHFRWTPVLYCDYGLSIKSAYGLFIILFIVTYYRELWTKPFYRVLFVSAIVWVGYMFGFGTTWWRGLNLAFAMVSLLTLFGVCVGLLPKRWKTLYFVLGMIGTVGVIQTLYAKRVHSFRAPERQDIWSRNFSLCEKDWRSVVFGQRMKLLEPWHNAWLDLWMRMGLVGVILWGAGFVYIYWLVLKNWRHFHLCVFVLVMWLTVSIAATCFMGYVSNFVQIYAIMYFLEYFYREKLYVRFEKRALKGGGCD